MNSEYKIVKRINEALEISKSNDESDESMAKAIFSKIFMFSRLT